jgi:hypothetical protein
VPRAKLLGCHELLHLRERERDPDIENRQAGHIRWFIEHEAAGTSDVDWTQRVARSDTVT